MPTSPLLNIQQVSPTQSQKEVTINDAISALEAAFNDVKDIVFAANAYALSVAEVTRTMFFICSGQTADATLTVPAQIGGLNTKRMFTVVNAGNYPITVEVAGGAGSHVIVDSSFTSLLIVDGAGNIRLVSAPVPKTYDIMFFFGSPPPVTEEVIYVARLCRNVVFPANFAGSLGYVQNNPEANYIMSVKKNGVEVGTITVAIDGTFSFTTSGGASLLFSAGDRIEVVGPIVLDEALFGIAVTLQGLMQ